MTKRVWFITGASRGIGAEITKAALEAGDSGRRDGARSEENQRTVPLLRAAPRCSHST